ncbi:unnamed protein product [Pseudo-nitzschia multistriata]|uniref:Uncharacterized protein n=1 Tax=Pseudo-nitzschia multistriata TaxID=183589 RepID=A0A448ZG21_9STRA|nr:unnamed protein product [Pseudo-nitzschia multistriata]
MGESSSTPLTPRRKTRKNQEAATTSSETVATASAIGSSTKKKRGRRSTTPKKEKGTETTQPRTPPTIESSATKKKRKRKITSPEPAPIPTPTPTRTNAVAKKEINRNAGPTIVEKDAVAPTSTTSKTTNKEYPATMDARVHRLRHMGYIPGSVSALTPRSTNCGQIVVARTDGSYELKSVTSPPKGIASSNRHYADNIRVPMHRLVTIAETPPATGRKPSNDEDSSVDSEMDAEDDESSLLLCPDAASSLCWVYPSALSSPVCVGSGPNGNLWIVDFKTSRPIDVVSSGGGGIFDLAVLSCGDGGGSDDNGAGFPFVAAACEDGSVRIWRVGSGDGSSRGQILQDTPFATLPSVGAPILSLVWRHVATRSKGKNRATIQTVVFAATADGTIRKYGLEIDRQQQIIDSSEPSDSYSIPNPPKSILRMTVESKGRKDSTKVWTLLLLRDNTVVAGNSLGQVQFWNGETGTLTQTIVQSNSRADVLKLVVDSDETKIFCSGVDSRVVCLERKKPPIKAIAAQQQSNATGSSKDLTALVASHLTSYRPWRMTVSQRPHTHDVKAMAIVASASASGARPTETLLTAGVDTKICSYSVSNFSQSQPQTWYPWPSATSLFSSSISTAKGGPRLVAMQRYNGIELYELEALKSRKNNHIMLSAHESHKTVIAQHPTSIPLGTIKLDGGEGEEEQDSSSVPTPSSPLRASLLSPDGQYLAVSNMSSTYVFYIDYIASAESPRRIRPRMIELPEEIRNVSATTFLFVGATLYVGDSSRDQKVYVARLRPGKTKGEDEDQMGIDVDDSKKKSLQETIILPTSCQTSSGQIALPIQSIHANDEFLVTLSHAQENAIHIFRRKTKNRPFEHFWTLPSLGGGTDARPAAVTLLDGNKLAVATYRSHLYLFDIETKSLNEWSEKYGFPLKDSKWTEDALCDRGYPVRLIPRQNGRLVLVSFGTFCVIDLTKPMPQRCRTVPKRPVWRTRKKYKAVVHDDGEDHDNVEDNDDHWLDSRVTKVVEDEYSHNDLDAEDDDATEAKNSQASASRSSDTKSIKVPNEIHDEELAARSCTICSHYKNILYANFLGAKEMIVVEQPWLDIVETFPAALQRKIYGAD